MIHIMRGNAADQLEIGIPAAGRLAIQRGGIEGLDGGSESAMRLVEQGDIVFHRGELADEMFLAAKGRYRVVELDLELRPGHIFGEMGLLTSGFQRTQSVECVESGHLLTISYDEVRELYFENPEFGFYFLRLVGERLLQNLKRAEDMLAEERQKHAPASGAP